MIFHCDKCGICRVGGKEFSVHCETCQCCIFKEHKESHKCVKGKLEDCPICMEDMQSSTMSTSVIPCGHAMHSKCLVKYINSSNLACPMCKKSIIDPSLFEAHMD